MTNGELTREWIAQNENDFCAALFHLFPFSSNNTIQNSILFLAARTGGIRKKNNLRTYLYEYMVPICSILHFVLMECRISWFWTNCAVLSPEFPAKYSYVCTLQTAEHANSDNSGTQSILLSSSHQTGGDFSWWGPIQNSELTSNSQFRRVALQLLRVLCNSLGEHA